MSLRNLMPSVKADDEDIVCPLQSLKEKCGEEKHAKELFSKYQTCNNRVNSRSNTTETCTEELFDYIAVVNHCVSKDLWSKLK